MIYPFLLVSSVVPSLLLIWYFHSRDVYPEPQRVVWATFALGVVTVVPVLCVAIPIGMAIKNLEDPYALGGAQAFLTAALPEELFKYLVVVFFCSRHKEFDEPMDGIVYGAVASLGFATLENVLYVMPGGLSAAVMRALTAVPAHAFMGAIMGYYVGQAKFNPTQRRALLVKGYVFPVLLHGFYDFPLLALKNAVAPYGRDVPEAMIGVIVGLAAATLAVLVFMWVWAVRLTRRLRREQMERRAREPPVPTWGPPPAYAYAQGYPPPPPPPGWGAPPQQRPYLQPWAGPPQYPGTQQPHPQPYYPGPPPYPHYGYPYAPEAPSVAGWLLTIFGALLACGGGVVLLGIVAALGMETVSDVETGPLVMGGLVLGVLPLAGGVVMFVFGLKRLANKPNVMAPRAA